jgi:hypothetical protein
MIIRTGKELAEMFAAIGDDVVAVEYWTHEDVLDFVQDDTDYVDVTEDVAREVWRSIIGDVRFFDYVDNDIIVSEIRDVLRKRMGQN